ncbi:Fic family protein [Herbiconiux flava]|uniref:Fic family protein n=1 Tax=Herbiconiux flava TaxID=881268 RepID=A0A852SAS4_9MICO|nr:Fic family protein [Herbiconiux flava]NYD69456.1 Fic family protein [Herbiconiux flava]GLK16201.1 Fic family protein [Herbiconiux flava]
MRWPPHVIRTVPWSQSRRAGTRADRMLSAVTVSIPPSIAALEVPIGASSAETAALDAIARLDQASDGQSVGALGMMLIRLESVASSKIEHLEAGVGDFARAIAGSRANESATAMVAASAAIHDLVTSVERGGRITAERILSAHAELMADDPVERGYAGRFRDVQNWIGGSDHSPRDALYVPPPPELVEPLIDDLLAFAHRDDLPPLLQAAIVHAQFESIHPFTDGNGRIGRALIQAVLRRRGNARTVVVPIASALSADRERYFGLLDAYRAGEVSPVADGIAVAARIAAEACLPLPQRLNELPREWRVATGFRRGSAADALLDVLPARPVVTASGVERELGVSYTAANNAVLALVEAGILTPLNQRKRDRAFVASEVMAELSALERLIGSRATAAFGTG